MLTFLLILNLANSKRHPPVSAQHALPETGCKKLPNHSFPLLLHYAAILNSIYACISLPMSLS